MMLKSVILIFLLFIVNLFPQAERTTKGAANGYAWLAMGDPSLPYSITKENYLNSILDRIKLTKEKHPEIASLSCKEDINKLSGEGKSNEISLNDVVLEMNYFYSFEDNLVIPIIFAYCYTIKKIAGVTVEELSDYRNEVLLFCYE